MAQQANSWDPGSIPGGNTSFDVPESSCLLSGPWLQLDSRYIQSSKVNVSYFYVGGQTGKDCLLTWPDGVKVADHRTIGMQFTPRSAFNDLIRQIGALSRDTPLCIRTKTFYSYLSLWPRRPPYRSLTAECILTPTHSSFVVSIWSKPCPGHRNVAACGVMDLVKSIKDKKMYETVITCLAIGTPSELFCSRSSLFFLESLSFSRHGRITSCCCSSFQPHDLPASVRVVLVLTRRPSRRLAHAHRQRGRARRHELRKIWRTSSRCQWIRGLLSAWPARCHSVLQPGRRL